MNSLGSKPIQASYRDSLVAYLQRHADALDEDSRRRLESNPLRILDSKNPAMADVLDGAPRIVDCLDDGSAEHFEALKGMLTECGIPFRVNSRLVRGLDYYTGTVFEWITDQLGAQGAVCGGGRYDNLIEEIGGAPAPAIGFAVGLERIVELMRAAEGGAVERRPHAFLAAVGP